MTLPTGTQIFIGPLAKPISKEISDTIGLGLGQIPEILEAHLPMVYIKGRIDPPAQVLVVVIDQPSPDLSERIRDLLRNTLPANAYMGVMEWGLNNPMLPLAKKAGCQLNLERKLN